ncbi:MAG: ABC transporter ATP-binding protein [Clostridia bacterium]|nr:ABC transporter ATP-binding protein [Clostridia bacterium]
MKDSARKWLMNVPGSRKWYIVGLLLVQALQGASGVLYALLLRGIVDSAVAGNRNGFWHYVLLIVGLTVAQLALRAVLRWLTERSKSTFENVFKERLLHTLLKKDYLRVSAVHSGEWMNRLTNDTVVVADGYVEILPGLVGMAVKLVSALAMVIAIEPRFALVLIPGGLVIGAFTILFRKVMKRLHKNVQESDGRLRVFLQERIESLLMLRSFAAEAQTRTDAAEKMLAHRSARMRRIRFSNLCNVGFGAAMMGMYLLGVGWCGYGILIGTVSFGTLTAIMQLITQIQTPIANITGYLPKYYAMLASAERLMEAEEFKEDGAEALPLSEMQDFYADSLSAFGLLNVDFAYYPVTESLSETEKTEMPIVLKNLSLEIKKDEYTAFTGTSGCGKSTALKLLMCVMQPDTGSRYYMNGQGEVRELTSAFRRLFAYVPQGNFLMSGTIREIVSFSDPVAVSDERRLKDALRIACADAFVSELEQGADTLLGEHGAGLSEGQMQRIAIARAIFSGSPVLLLDEATSALDTETEKRLLENLRSMTDKTVVIVTHRPAALSICDRVLEFTEDGVIETAGKEG